MLSKFMAGSLLWLVVFTAVSVGCVKDNTASSDSSLQATPSATPTNNPDGSVTIPPGLKPSACGVNERNSDDCLMVKGSYFYSVENGGRSPDQVSDILVYGILAHVLPIGWYSGTSQAVFSDSANVANSDLKPENIRKDTIIFGVTGTLNTVKPEACNLSTQPVPLPGNNVCLMSSGLYVYSAAYGGRSQVCSNTNNTTISSCWINDTKTYYLTAGAESPLPECLAADIDNSSSGVSANCWVRPGHYYYSNAYGGRGSLCNTTEAVNTATCWADSISSSNKAVVSAGNFSNWCAWNSKTNSTCRARINVTVGPGDNPSPASKTYGYVYQEQFGGRNTYCLKDGSGRCWLAVEKTQLEPNLRPENIKAGVTIFGITGKFRGEGSWKSGAHRDSVSNPLSLSDESFVYAGTGDKDAGFPDGYREIPLTEFDDEGTYSSTMFQVDRTGWGDLTCGLEKDNFDNNVILPPGFSAWTVRARIANCGSVFGSSSVWDGALFGNAGQSKWKLVLRTGNVASGKGRELWLDENTGMLWSSLVSTSINWCKASGSNNIGGNSAAENDTFDICDNSSYQSVAGNAVSACFEGTGFTVTDSSIDSGGKGGLSQASALPVGWRLPTLYDYEVAEYNGIRFVLPDMGAAIKATSGSFFEWTATTDSNNKKQAWAIASIPGGHGLIDRSMTARARCIGRANITQ